MKHPDGEPWPPGQDVELMAAGRSWDAVRVLSHIAHVVHSRLGTGSGAVIEDPYGMHLYWLVRPGTADGWNLPQHFVEIRGTTSYVAVPPVHRTDGPGLRWIVPPTPRRYLTDSGQLASALAREINAVLAPRLP
jgi:hypothetical protein